VDEAKTLYPKLGIAANCGLVLAGSFTRLVNEGVARGNNVMSMQVRGGVGVGFRIGSGIGLGLNWVACGVGFQLACLGWIWMSVVGLDLSATHTPPPRPPR